MPELPVSQSSTALDRIWAGMPVIDANGTTIGTVRQVHPPGSAAEPTLRHAQDDQLTDAFVQALTDDGQSAMPTAVAERLAQQGFLKVSGLGLVDHDRYVTAGQIAAADEEEVRLTAVLDELTVEHEMWA